MLSDAERLQKPMYSARGKVTSTDKGGDKSVADMSAAERGKRDMLTVVASRSLVRWRRRTTTTMILARWKKIGGPHMVTLRVDLVESGASASDLFAAHPTEPENGGRSINGESDR